MDDFFNETELERTLNHISNPTKEIFNGAKLYKAIDKIKGVIRMGDFFYIDTALMNHLEVFDSIKEFSHVLKFDGTVNRDKTDKAKGRKVSK
ncbi:Uncharacterized protein MCB1EB_0914 [Mycoavidus cysteinexigens]|uniref:Uncharacterized protein n=2 Tax=Mycoavidus cysteinexigens TaxID=1553431 RepID=A0A2Z6EVG6_9BURK|nr:hypothetical protein [Mycoavidus cysteinexigens]BBE09075.1 Uncharacterized protein MCB1EB_0914 [Mycoavidus cysteinexigens]GAM52190.1 hemolysin/hemagglutinin-like protein HecA precursor [bacterium endosymbiont of Mortierella elongata FMR23-6]GLR00260.1 hypothetical protein GCM10007934_00710 [Mycoavidus cysteinexigens]